MPDIRNTTDTTLKVFETITTHLRIVELRIRIRFGVKSELVASVLLRTT